MLKRKRKKPLEMPELSQLKAELTRGRAQGAYVVAARAILVAVLWMPVLRIYGNSMTPTVSAGEIVVSWKGSSFAQGDLIAMYYANKLLVKRVIAGPGEWVDIDEDGNVFVNEKPLDEPYLVEKALGDCDIELPFQVPEDRYFVMGDHRSTSADSRLASIGPIPAEDVVGRIIFRVWPVERFGPLK